MSYLSLRDYGLVGNEAVAALVSRNGSVDWYCAPQLDSPSHFGALLDENQGGRFQIAPSEPFRSEQRYLDETNVLETRFETGQSSRNHGTLTDWISLRSQSPVLHRRIRCLQGEINWKIHCSPRFAYGAESAQAERYRDGILFRGHSSDEMAFLRCDRPLQFENGGASATGQIRLTAGEEAWLSWIWGRAVPTEAPHLNPSGDLEAVLKYWRSVAHRCPKDGSCPYAGPWHDSAVRSDLLLRLMTHSSTGAIVGSITTSLPNLMGGTRNWDYRYSWLREAALAVRVFGENGGPSESARSDRTFRWIADILRRDGAERLQSAYTIDGGRHLPERELPFLGGYAGSRPVRIGNLSARQLQLDIYGHVAMAVDQRFFGSSHPALPSEYWDSLWEKLADVAEHVSQAWRRPDRGGSELRAKPEHYVASKALCWVSLERTIALARSLGKDVPKRWLHERDVLHRTICEQGFDPKRRSFVRSFGERVVDSSVLMLPMVGFLPLQDDRILGTLDAVREDLADGVLINRHRSVDGVPEADGAHVASSLWYVSCLALCGRTDEASDRLAELCTYSTPLGLFGELVDPLTGEPAGNFPNVSAHLALLQSSHCVNLARRRTLSSAQGSSTAPKPDVTSAA